MQGICKHFIPDLWIIVFIIVTPADGLGSALALPIMGKGMAEAYEIAQARP